MHIPHGAPTPDEALLRLMKGLDARLIRRGDDQTGTPYLWRGYLAEKARAGGMGAFLHRFVSSDEIEYHCHPWTWAYTFILSGSYREDRVSALLIDFDASVATLDGSTRVQTIVKAGDANIIMAHTFHRVELLTPEVFSLFIHGPRAQDWGFVPMNDWGRPLPMRLMSGHTRDRLPKETVR